MCASDQEEILERGGDCDLAIVLYDTSRQDSFSKAVEIQERLDVPSVFIGEEEETDFRGNLVPFTEFQSFFSCRKNN